MKYEVFQDQHVLGNWRAEAIDHDSDGECYVVIFSGPNAKERAEWYVALISDPDGAVATERARCAAVCRAAARTMELHPAGRFDGVDAIDIPGMIARDIERGEPAAS